MLSRTASRANLGRCSSRKSLQWPLKSLVFYMGPSQLQSPPPYIRSSSSSTRWKSRQGRDSFAREAKVQGLKSRAAFKLLEIDARYKIFKKGQTIVDLGYAPGSWSQVAVERTKPNGRIVGIDIIPAQPPKGVSTIQGNFLSAGVRDEVKRFLSDPDRGRPKQQFFTDEETGDVLIEEDRSYIDLERHADDQPKTGASKKREKKAQDDPSKMVDVVLSDMSAPWEQTTGFWKRTLSNPYRMMNTSGIAFKDHAGSMDLCNAALQFAHDTLRVGGHFVCKFYQGSEDKDLEKQLKKMFKTVHREKPESSRSESKEAYFVALRKKVDLPGIAVECGTGDLVLTHSAALASQQNVTIPAEEHGYVEEDHDGQDDDGR